MIADWSRNVVEKEVLLYSAGMDSFIAWRKLKQPPALFCRLQHRYMAKELSAAFKIESKTKMKLYLSDVVNLKDWETKTAFIPGRNFYLLMTAALPESVKKIYLVCQKGEQSLPDRSPMFFAVAETALSAIYGRTIKVVNPFAKKTKQQMVKWYLDNVGVVDWLKTTVGCFNGKTKKGCGECKACFRRAVSFAANNIFEAGEYEKDIRRWSGIKEYVIKMNIGEYEAERTEETLNVLRDWGWKC